MDKSVSAAALGGIAGPSLTDRLVGAGCALLAVAIWGGWIVSTRHAVHGHLPPMTVGWLRFVVPAVVLAPAWIRIGLWPRRNFVPFLLCFFGAGVFFFLDVANAMRFVPAADVGPLLPGTMPLIVAAISVLVFRERLGTARAIGFSAIALGVVTLGSRGLLYPEDGAWRGHGLLLIGACMWSCYTLAFRRTGMKATETVGLVGLWSTAVLTPYGLPGVVDAVANGYGREVLIQLLVQGVLSGVVALVAFGVAIERLGSSRAAAFTGLVPALAALIAVPVLGEHPDTAAIVGVVATGIGVTLASGALGGRR
ncbi:DMT family transporter [Ancylobacter dichloromethanicus]|uniref:Membrane protein n=1 Tax=Ancylobacter dichloromethanicus TaxID=518825 RepID=A0A9W6J766_9HYPH|nr:DMT family transporter [Ancylobacter dichloromethanicus]MBS7555308.1 DMT family transporter [Ancylobacter dichloromethanicus]GLK70490.1 membrane protein [Ancylobacter dichloromethanicus]